MDFIPKHDRLVCIDSDGCAIDSMNIKHIRAFGPQVVAVFGLEQIEKGILTEWNRINLFSEKRGIHRFLGLREILGYAAEQGYRIEGLDEYGAFIERGASLNHATLEEEYQKSGKEIFRLAIEYSGRVNNEIEKIDLSLKKPFANVREVLAKLSERADIAVVSSANGAAVLEEWDGYGLSPYISVFCTQEMGAKAECIARLMEFGGYARDKALKIGDAYGDWKAAKQNGILFYPILAGKENASWQELLEKYADLFLKGEYTAVCEEKRIQSFRENLS